MVPKLIKNIEDIFGDGIANISMYDFSRGNIDEQSRIDHITTVASICYANDTIIGKESLYNRLAAEAAGLPSSSFEFIPVFLDKYKLDIIVDLYSKLDNSKALIPNIIKYGKLYNGESIITNYRALLYDYEYLKRFGIEDIDFIIKWYNTEAECDILKANIFTFLTKMDIATTRQYNRHRIPLQELSRRYVSGDKMPFEIYYEVAMLNKIGPFLAAEVLEHGLLSIALYNKLRDVGIKPQSARRVIPISSYTQVWGAFNIDQVNNFLILRSADSAQWEIRKIAEAMLVMIPMVNNTDIYNEPVLKNTISKLELVK